LRLAIELEGRFLALNLRMSDESDMVVSFLGVWLRFVRGLLTVPRLGWMCAKNSFEFAVVGKFVVTRLSGLESRPHKCGHYKRNCPTTNFMEMPEGIGGRRSLLIRRSICLCSLQRIGDVAP
jgi:hypothetical protein